MQKFIWLLVLCSAPIFARTASGLQTAPTSELESTPLAEFERSLDSTFSEIMTELHIPGAVFVMVKDGSILLSKGYGYANLKKKISVNPEETVFRVASISKIFVVTAIMQLYERGLIKLNDDVNQHLKLFKLEENFSEPVTFSHLMTHTAGFDHSGVGMATLEEENLLPLGEYLSKNMPGRLREPGKQYSYSRHGLALAGYLVEEVSGMSFDDFVQENILQPLRMDKSGFQIPSDFENLSKGYSYKDGKYEPVPYHHFYTGPEASLNATANDMAKFLIAHLQRGEYQNIRILKDSTAVLMHGQHFTHHSKLPGMAFGFSERIENGQRAIQHGGHIRGFVSRLLLLPKHNMGFFVSCNNDEYKLISAVTKQFYKHFFPKTKPTHHSANSLSFENHLDRFTGTYRDNEIPHSTLEKIFSVRKQFRIEAQGNEYLKISTNKKWVATDSLTFQRVDTGEISVFKENSVGEITHWFRKRHTYEKLRFYETAQFHTLAVGLMGLAFLYGIFLWVTSFFRKLRSIPKWLYCLTVSISLVNILFIALIFFVLYYYDGSLFTLGIPSHIILLLCLPLISVFLTVVGFFFILKYRTQKVASSFECIQISFVYLTSLAFNVQLHYWNLLGFHF